LELRAAFKLFRVICGAHVGALRNAGRSCGTRNWPLLVSSQEGVQHRQTYSRLSRKFLDVGPRDGNTWELASETDQRISGAHAGVWSAFRCKGVSPNEEYDGEANGQDEACYAGHASLLSGAGLGTNGTFDSCAALNSQIVNKMPAVLRVGKNVPWNTRRRPR
jgi:hypothetical protein